MKRIIFFGTPAFAARVYTYLIQHGFCIVAVVTRPDKPQGRSLKMLPSAVKQVAQSISPHIPIYQPKRASSLEFVDILKTLQADLFVVVAYGEIIKTELLNLPPLGCINVHPSLLPKYRGAAPIQRCLMNGDSETGVCIMEMVLEMDAGDILEMCRVNIPADMLFGELDSLLSDKAGPLLADVICHIEEKRQDKKMQNPALVTFASKVSAADEEIDWDKTAEEIHNQIRAFSPLPGAWCWVEIQGQKKRLKIKRSQVEAALQGPSKQTLIFNKSAWVVSCKYQAINILDVQLEGKKPMSIGDFLRGLQVPPVLL